MEKFMEDFTIIDFWGIFMPGAVVIFLTNDYFHFSLFYQSIFAATEITVGSTGLLLYFVAISYLTGTLIHEISDWLERLLSYFVSFLGNCRVLKDNQFFCPYLRRRAFLWLDKKTKEYITENLFENQLETKKSNDFLQAMNRIRTATDEGSGAAKRKMFESFRIMARNTAFSLTALLIASSFWNPALTYHQVLCRYWLLTIFLIVLFDIRAIHYTYLKYKYSYETYALLVQEKLVQKKAN